MGERFQGQVVLITGAGGGFGAAAAQRFAAEGALLVLSDRDQAALDRCLAALPGSAQAFGQCVDVTSETALAEHVADGEAALGPVDVAINNAGIGQAMVPLQATPEDLFDRVMAVNAKGVFNGLKAVLPGMIARRSGRVLSIASAAGLVGAGHIAAYAASKHAVVGLTKSAADEVARFGVQVNALCPSFAPTPLYAEIRDGFAAAVGLDADQADDRITQRIPMRRVATVEEVVRAMLMVTDPANSFMTGQAVAVDGGLTAV